MLILCTLCKYSVISLGSISNKHPYEGDELKPNFILFFKCSNELTTIVDFGGIIIKGGVGKKLYFF